MSQERDAKRRAYEAAKTYQRSYYEKYYPVRTMGGRPAEAVTPEVLIEIERLKAATEEARAAWEAARRA